ncbi:unnamed protein product, partial [Rotaria socialis]
ITFILNEQNLGILHSLKTTSVETTHIRSLEPLLVLSRRIYCLSLNVMVNLGQKNKSRRHECRTFSASCQFLTGHRDSKSEISA